MVTCPYCAAPHETAEAGLAVCSACLNPILVKSEGAAPRAVAVAAQDIRKVATPGTIGGELIKALPKALDDLPILPEISQRILKSLRDPSVSMRDLADIIRQDQVIAVRILKLANSAMYGGLQEITELNAACARLGARNVANAVQAIANGNLYITGNESCREQMRQLWRHALATAQCAAEIANVIAEPRADELFVAGLIHDIGRVVLLDIVANQYRGVLGELRNSPELLEEVFTGYSALIGLHVVVKWNLPLLFRSTTYYLRQPEDAPENARRAIHVVALAEAVAEVSGYGLGMHITSLVGLPSARALGMTDIKLAMVRADLEDKIKALVDLTPSA